MGDRAEWVSLAVTAAIIIALTVGTWFLLKRLVKTLSARRGAESEVWTRIDACRSPAVTVLFLILIRTYGAVLEFLTHGNHWIGTVLGLLVLLSFGWLASRGAAVLIAVMAVRFTHSTGDDHQRLSRIRTQLGVFQRAAAAVIWLATLIFALLDFPSTRALATSLFASAGLLGLVFGLAAQSTLANMIAGLQIAFSDSVRIDDTVQVNGKHGVVEEITLTYISIRMQDNRRMIVPVTDFVNQPFENWTRKNDSAHVDSYLYGPRGPPRNPAFPPARHPHHQRPLGRRGRIARNRRIRPRLPETQNHRQRPVPTPGDPPRRTGGRATHPLSGPGNTDRAASRAIAPARPRGPAEHPEDSPGCPVQQPLRYARASHRPSCASRLAAAGEWGIHATERPALALI
ncbi:mechanosensitive ion channel domain-containing protein [Nocardia jiangxiensis]|uniref:Mechanosensitive ion channel domain-containing protein n=1 Tax=Nocardia jiangxiensis TaxID=282685 RepID=A0ABW6SE51_9NOCA